MPQELLHGRKAVPSYEGALRSHMIMIPPCISECSDIRVFGSRIKSLAFTTDAAIIRYIHAARHMKSYISFIACFTVRSRPVRS